MADNTTITSSSVTEYGSFFIAYYSFFLVIFGTLFNFLTFLILCRTSFKDAKKQPTIHYMRAIAIFDISMLYTWNLDHYLFPVYGFSLLNYSVLSCKIDQYFGYFTAQTSTWLRVFVCIDRYMLLSRHHRIWFNQSKTVVIIITCIISFFALFNLHILIFNCYYTSNGSVNLDAFLYSIFPAWNYVHLIVYNWLPFILMIIFNSGVIYHIIYLRRGTIVQNSRARNVSISITLILTTFLFLIMTTPGNIVYTFFYNTSALILLPLVDGIMFTYHITSFPLYFITLNDFRNGFISMITLKKMNPRIAPNFNDAQTQIQE